MTDQKKDPVRHRGQEINWITYDEAAKFTSADWQRLLKHVYGSMSDEEWRKRYMMGQRPTERKEGEDNGKRKNE